MIENKGLESYYKTENEHWNKYALDMLCKVVQEGNFENPELPLQLFDKGIRIVTEHHLTPVQAVEQVDSEAEAMNLAQEQKRFIFEWICKYVTFSDFEELDLSNVSRVLESYVQRLKKKPPIEYDRPLTQTLRDTLKATIQAELEQLPQTLKKMDSVQRLNVVTRLLPYVLPKVESVTHKLGEPDSDNNGLKW
jgi:hypothetical protein